MAQWELIELQDLPSSDRIELAPPAGPPDMKNTPERPGQTQTARLVGDTVRFEDSFWATFRRGEGHDFQTCSSTHLSWCDLCGEFIWGIYKQSLCCTNCRYTCHYRCRPFIQLDCEVVSGHPDHGEDVETDTNVALPSAQVSSVVVRECCCVKSGEIEGMGEEKKPYFEMSWGRSSAASSGYGSQDDSDSELELFYTARSSFPHEPESAEDAVVEWGKQQQLSFTELQHRIKEYNAQINSNLYMSLNRDGSYTGFIKVQFQLVRPISLPPPDGPTSLSSSSSSSSTQHGHCTSFYLPRDVAKQLHVSSSTRVREVIEALLTKFTVVDNPAKFALYERSERNGQVYVRKLADDEQPLLLRLCAGPSEKSLSFMLRENETGEVNWDAFSLPELSNFLRILQREEEDHVRQIEQRYTLARVKLKEALRSFSTPG